MILTRCPDLKPVSDRAGSIGDGAGRCADLGCGGSCDPGNACEVGRPLRRGRDVHRREPNLLLSPRRLE